MEDILKFATDPKTLILKEILRIFESSDGISIKKFICKLPDISKKIGLVLFAFFLTTQFEKLSSKLINFIEFGLKFLFYKKFIFDKSDVEYTYFNTYFSKKTYHNGCFTLPINNMNVDITKRNQMISVNANKYLHNELFKDLELFKKKVDKTISIFKKYDGIKLVVKKPMNLFDSENYLKLMKNVETFVYQSTNTDMITTLSMIIDGEPGLGKTKFSEYICHKKSSITGQKIFDNVYLIDMTESFSEPYENIFNIAYFDVEILGPTLFVIDEIDKYLSFKIDEEYKNHKDSCRSQNTQPDSYKNFKSVYKSNFLNWLLKILERSGENYPIIVIFCCNNFSDIFSDIDMKHYESLINRIVVQTFKKCNTNETKKYLEYLNHKMGTDYEINIDFEVNITFRSLFQITVLENYNIPDIISRIKNPKNISFSIQENSNFDEKEELVLIDKNEELVLIDENEKLEYKEIDKKNIDYNDQIYTEFCMYSVSCLNKPCYTIKKTENHIMLRVCGDHYKKYIELCEKYLGYNKIKQCHHCNELDVFYNINTNKCNKCENTREKNTYKSLFCCHRFNNSINLCSVSNDLYCCFECKKMFRQFAQCYNCNNLISVTIPYEYDENDYINDGELHFLKNEVIYDSIVFRPIMYLCSKCDRIDLESNFDIDRYIDYFEKNYVLKKIISLSYTKNYTRLKILKKSNIYQKVIHELTEEVKHDIIHEEILIDLNDESNEKVTFIEECFTL